MAGRTSGVVLIHFAHCWLITVTYASMCFLFTADDIDLIWGTRYVIAVYDKNAAELSVEAVALFSFVTSTTTTSRRQETCCAAIAATLS